MGMNMSVYVGCYLHAPSTNINVTNIYYLDSNGKRTSNKFDPETGQPNKEMKETIIEKVEPSTYSDDFWEEMEAKGIDEDAFNALECYDIWISNSDSCGCGNINEYEGGNIDLTNINIEEEIKKFKEANAKELDFYMEKYPQLELRFGVVAYWS